MEKEKNSVDETDKGSTDYFDKSIAENDHKNFTPVDYTYDDDDDLEHHYRWSRIGKPFKFVFPDRYPLSWFSFHLILIGTFFIFKCNSPDKDNPKNVLGDELTLGGLVSMILIFTVNLLIHILLMFIRFILVRCILNRLCSNNALFLALLNMLDPTIFYAIFSWFQSMLWQVMIYRDPQRDGIYYINLFSNTQYGSFFTFNKESIQWVSYGVYLYVILSIRCLLLSVVTFLFELGFLMSSNDSMKKYLELYIKLRRFNILWISYSLTKPNLMQLIDSLYKNAGFEKVEQDEGSKRKKFFYNTGPMFKEGALTVLKDHKMNSGDFKKTVKTLDLPTQVTESLISSSSNSKLKNWMLAYYVTKTSPCISLLHQDIVLKNEEMIQKVSEMLFDQIYATTNDYQSTDKMDSETMDNNYAALVNSDSGPEREEPKKNEEIDITNLEELPAAIINTAIDLTENTINEVAETAKEVMGIKPRTTRFSRTQIKEKIEKELKHRKSKLSTSELRPPGTRAINIDTPTSLPDLEQAPESSEKNHARREFKLKRLTMNANEQNEENAKTMKKFYNLKKLRETLSSEELNIHDVLNFRGPEVDEPRSSFDYVKTPIKYKYDRTDLFISRERLALFIPEEDLDRTINLIDISGHGRINFNIIKQALTNLFSSRKKFKRNLKGQQSVFRVVKRLMSAFSWIVSLVILSFMAGMKIEAIVVSGAALLSALTVALSYMYTNFINSIIFVAFSNPYNVGDRVRLDNGEPLIVKKIRTYTTEFVSIHGKIMIYQNSLLSTMKITNESRSETATLELVFKIDVSTTDAQMDKFTTIINKALNCRPNDFVKNSAILVGYDFFPGHCYEVGLWLTCIESWGNWQRIYQLRTEVLQLIVRVCKELGITYVLPTQPIHFKETLEISNLKSKV